MVFLHHDMNIIVFGVETKISMNSSTNTCLMFNRMRSWYAISVAGWELLPRFPSSLNSLLMSPILCPLPKLQRKVNNDQIIKTMDTCAYVKQNWSLQIKIMEKGKISEMCYIFHGQEVLTEWQPPTQCLVWWDCGQMGQHGPPLARRRGPLMEEFQVFASAFTFRKDKSL